MHAQLNLEMRHPGYSLQTYEQSPLGKIVHEKLRDNIGIISGCSLLRAVGDQPK
jgi:hypothetical protein